MQPLGGIYETVLYAENLEAATEFYRDVLGLRLVDTVDGLVSSFRLSDGSMLLIFDPSSSSAANRPVPSHGAQGPGHVAFRVDATGFERWQMRLADLSIEIQKERADAGTGQLYFRDPAGNSVELVCGELWPR